MKHLLALACTLACFSMTHAWGKQGHEIVANLAWTFLSNTTQDKISDMLGIKSSSSSSCDGCSPLAVIADWADAVRHTQYYQWTAPLHYIDVRDDLILSGCPAGEKDTMDESCHFDYARDCPNDFCVAGAIVNYTNILMDASSHNASVEALKFLTHFVGDIHQPLHASRTTDRGGNSIHVSFHGDQDLVLSNQNERNRRHRQLRGGHSSAKTLHGVWDDDIIEKALHGDFSGSRVLFEEYLQAWMKTNFNYVHQWLACPVGNSQACTTLWGEESFHHAIEWAYRNVDGSSIADGDVLTEQYQQTRRPIVEQRLAAGGIRLAVTLEMALYGSRLQMASFFGK